jgi:hypothetical protein
MLRRQNENYRDSLLSIYVNTRQALGIEDAIAQIEAIKREKSDSCTN